MHFLLQDLEFSFKSSCMYSYIFFTRKTQTNICVVMTYKITSLLETDQGIKEYQIITFNK